MKWSMRVLLVTGLGLLALAELAIRPAAATVSVAIDLTHQRMHVVSPHGSYDWPISSARSGFTTPGGSYAPTRLELMHYSKKYHMSPMPHAIFFRGGYAIHGTYSVGELGRPASHGCVRLSPGHAATLYAMVQAEGARISIAGTPPASRPFRRAREPRVFIAQHFIPHAVEAKARPARMAHRTALVRASDKPSVLRRGRLARRVVHVYGGDPIYGYGAIYNEPPVRAYAPAYVSTPQGFGGGPLQPPLVPAYGD